MQSLFRCSSAFLTLWHCYFLLKYRMWILLPPLVVVSNPSVERSHCCSTLLTLNTTLFHWGIFVLHPSLALHLTQKIDPFSVPSLHQSLPTVWLLQLRPLGDDVAQIISGRCLHETALTVMYCSCTDCKQFWKDLSPEWNLTRQQWSWQNILYYMHTALSTPPGSNKLYSKLLYEYI